MINTAFRDPITGRLQKCSNNSTIIYKVQRDIIIPPPLTDVMGVPLSAAPPSATDQLLQKILGQLEGQKAAGTGDTGLGGSSASAAHNSIASVIPPPPVFETGLSEPVFQPDVARAWQEQNQMAINDINQSHEQGRALGGRSVNELAEGRTMGVEDRDVGYNTNPNTPYQQYLNRAPRPPPRGQFDMGISLMGEQATPWEVAQGLSRPMNEENEAGEREPIAFTLQAPPQDFFDYNISEAKTAPPSPETKSQGETKSSPEPTTPAPLVPLTGRGKKDSSGKRLTASEMRRRRQAMNTPLSDLVRQASIDRETEKIISMRQPSGAYDTSEGTAGTAQQGPRTGRPQGTEGPPK